MKTLQELYKEITTNEELKIAFLEAAKAGKVAGFLKEHGVEATEEEIKAFLKEQKKGELSDEELDNVAGGTCNGETCVEVFGSIATAGIGCAAVAAMSALGNGVGQQSSDGGRLCTFDD